MAEEHMLSTVDNPFNPFHQFDEWYAWDVAKGYHSMAFLARVIVTSDELPQEAQDLAMEQAIAEIVEENVFGVHIAVTENDTAPRQVTVAIAS